MVHKCARRFGEIYHHRSDNNEIFYDHRSWSHFLKDRCVGAVFHSGALVALRYLCKYLLISRRDKFKDFCFCFFPTQEYFSASRALHYYPQLGVTYAKRENKKISGGQIKAQESTLQ